MVKFLEYPLSKKFPQGSFFHVGFGLFAILLFTVLVLWSAATAGYENTSVFRDDFNITDNEHWYDRFIPDVIATDRRGKLCQSLNLGPGDSFQTRVGVFDWTLLTFTNESLDVDLDTAADFHPYQGQDFDGCDVGTIGLDLNLQTFSLSGHALIQCFGSWPIFAKASFAHTMNIGSSDLLTGPASLGSLSAYAAGRKVQNDLLYAMMDVWNTAQLRSTVIDGLSALGLTVSTIDPDGPGIMCPKKFNTPQRGCNMTADLEKPVMYLSTAFAGYTNGTFEISENQLVFQPVITAINNYLQIVHAAVRYDIANVRPNNLYTNSSLASQYINTQDETLPLLLGASTIVNGANDLAQVEHVPIRTQYLCQIKQLKAGPSFVFSVAGLALSNFAAIWGAVILVLGFTNSRRNADAMACEHHSAFPAAAPPSQVVTGAGLSHHMVPTLSSKGSYQSGHTPYQPGSGQGYSATAIQPMASNTV